MNGPYRKPDTRMFTKTDRIVFGIIAIMSVLAIVTWKSVNYFNGKGKTHQLASTKKSGKDSANAKQKSNAVASGVSIVNKWELPAILKEVSGICFMDEHRIACVQDELGKIFIFNKTSNKIEKEISFGKNGDYEGIAVKGNIAYVLRADGKLFEVGIDAPENAPVKEHQTSLTLKHNVEGLGYDRENDRLLLAIKDDEPGKPGYKGIYSFDLAKNQFIDDPVFKIDLNNEIISNSKKKSVMPSAISVHPKTGELFITDGPQSKLLVMDRDGKISRLLELGKDFAQPEGITFGSQGEVFISNEGTKQPGNILEVLIN
jgi:uncharacterized protein YjiK